ncbi:MAG: hypothetical protein LBC88_00955 [Spirochaetaceae bacterium]|jgi:adenylate cyclase class IV|nr:hypothetical protein [Spirochaetaceae bacterium]
MMNIQIENKLDRNNIDKTIELYINSLKEMELKISANNIIELLEKLKRENIDKGPYHNITLFEAANRIMSDLVILFGVRNLLDGKYKDVNFSQYIVEYGNENNNEHDIMAEDKKNGIKLIGEAFNVSKSFFQTKKYNSLKKLRKNKSKNIIRYYCII